MRTVRYFYTVYFPVRVPPTDCFFCPAACILSRMLLIFIPLLAAAGFLILCLSAGFVLFGFLCARSVYSKHSFVDNADHIKDEKVYPVLLEAKNRADEKSQGKVSIRSAPVRRPFPVPPFFPKKTLKLCADLRLQNGTAPAGGENSPSRKTRSECFAVLVHGFSDSARGMAYLAEAYYKNGFSVLSVNLRAHGESEGHFAGLGHLTTDAADLALWLRFLIHRFGKDIRIALHGVSMGAAAVIQCAYGIIAVRSEFADEKAALQTVAADCGFYRFSEQVERQLSLFLSAKGIQRTVFGGAAKAASFFNILVNGFSFSADCPGTTLAACTQAQPFNLVLFHGSADTLVPPADAHRLYEAAHDPKRLVVTEGAPHIGSFFYAPDKYLAPVLQHFRD